MSDKRVKEFIDDLVALGRRQFDELLEENAKLKKELAEATPLLRDLLKKEKRLERELAVKKKDDVQELRAPKKIRGLNSEAIKCDQCGTVSRGDVNWWHVAHVVSYSPLEEAKDFCSNECAYDFFAAQMKAKRDKSVKGEDYSAAFYCKLNPPCKECMNETKKGPRRGQHVAQDAEHFLRRVPGSENAV